VSASQLFWFHCGRCGALFQDRAGDPDLRRCAVCGEDPNPGMTENASAQAASARRKRGRRTKQKGKGRFTMLKILLLWILVTGLIIVYARSRWPQQNEPTPDTLGQTETTSAVADLKKSENLALYQKARRECAATFIGFLKADSPDARTQFVFSPFTISGRMLNFYSMNPSPVIDTATLQYKESSLLDLPGETAFEAYWTTGEGKILETVFRLENDEWRLDWQHFVRYSDHPWTLFLAGTGPEEGEFRLLARERLAEERKDEASISLVLYAPRFGDPNEMSSQSPEFLVSRGSRDGKLLDAGFKQVRSGARIFGSTLPKLGPSDLLRVRVKVRRVMLEDNRPGYEITAVRACHWLTLDDPGVELEPEAEAVPQETR